MRVSRKPLTVSVAATFLVFIMTMGYMPQKPTLVVDMHYGILLGVGWTPADFGSQSVAVTTEAVPEGSYVIPVSQTFGLNPGILAVYQAVDDEWHSFVIRGRADGVVFADRPLKAMSLGATVSNAYKNDAHPNLNGGAAIVDFTIRQLTDPIMGRATELERVLRDSQAWSATNALVSFSPSSDYTNLGSNVVGFRSTKVTGSSPGGATTGPVPLMGGDYFVSIPINTGLKGADAGSVTLTVEELDPINGIKLLASSNYVGFNATFLARMPFKTGGEYPVRVRAVSSSGGSWSFGLGQVMFERVTGAALPISEARHVLLADSWGTPEGPDIQRSPIAQRLAAKLGDSLVAIKGVSGNRSDQLISRFSADVAPFDPDYVWVIVGTNDYYQGVSPEAFENNIATLKGLIKGIGAIPIFLTPSVGAITYTPPQFFPSRQLRTFTRLHDFAEPPPTLTQQWRNLSVFQNDVQVPANSEKTMLLSPGVTTADAFINFVEIDNPELSVVAGFVRNGVMRENYRITAGSPRRKLWLRHGDPEPARVFLGVVNTTDEQRTFSCSIDIGWKGDLS